jgi:hypothetical protein
LVNGSGNSPVIFKVFIDGADTDTARADENVIQIVFDFDFGRHIKVKARGATDGNVKGAKVGKPSGPSKIGPHFTARRFAVNVVNGFTFRRRIIRHGIVDIVAVFPTSITPYPFQRGSEIFALSPFPGYHQFGVPVLDGFGSGFGLFGFHSVYSFMVYCLFGFKIGFVNVNGFQFSPVGFGENYSVHVFRYWASLFREGVVVILVIASDNRAKTGMVNAVNKGRQIAIIQKVCASHNV